MAASSASAVWRASVLTLLLASVVHCNDLSDYDPLQPTTSDETVSVGGTVTLTCRVDETDNSSLQWSNTAQQTLYFGEKRALRDNRIQLHRSTPTELSITISEVQLADEGEYTCSIFTMPVRTARATVTVLGVPSKPQISGFEAAVPEGGEVTLTCTSSGSKPPAELHWYRGTERLSARPDVVESTPGEPTYSVRSEVTLTVSRGDDNAMVTCAVVHPSLAPGDKRSSQALHVLYSPEVKILPQTDLPKEGERFRLTCEGSGNPEPTTFSWKKKDGELGPLVKIEGAFLYFEMLNKSDNGVYECEAGNGIGNLGLGEYTLSVQDSDWTPTPPVSTFIPTSEPEITESTPASPTTSVSHASETTTALSNALFPDSTHSVHDHTHSTHGHAHIEHDHAHTEHDHAHTDHEHDHTHSPHDHTHSPHDHTHSPHDHTHSPHDHTHSLSDHAPSVTTETSGGNATDAEAADPTAMAAGTGVDHAVIGGVVAVIVFILLCLLIVLGRYLIRHKGTYLTHEAKGSDDAPDADTAIINAEGGTSGAEDKKEYFI